ncbi:hypothetical protein D3C85_1189000 [compost metagenome]
MLEQVVPARRSEAQAEVPGNFTRQPAPFEVVDGSLACRVALEGLAIIVGCCRQQRIERRIGRLPGLVAAPAFFAGHFHAGGLGQVLDSLGEIQIVVVHEKAQGVTARAAAKAVVELLVGAHAERRGLFLVERAAGGVVLACFFQLYARAHHIDDVGAVEEVVDKTLGNQPGHGVLIIRRLSGGVVAADCSLVSSVIANAAATATHPRTAWAEVEWRESIQELALPTP